VPPSLAPVRPFRVAVGVVPSARERHLRAPARERLSAYADEVVWCDEDSPWSDDAKRRILADVDAYITGWGDSGMSPEVVAAATRLRMVAVIGSSVARFAPEALFDRGVHLTHTAHAIGVTVAEFAAAAILGLAHNLLHVANRTAAGDWRADAPWPAFNIKGKRLAMIGCGAVGRHLIKLLRGFDPDVLIYDPYLSDHQIAQLGARRATLETALSEGDIITLHLGLTPETTGMLGPEHLALIPDDAVLVNTARGGVFDEEALAERLRGGAPRALLDVFNAEPLPDDSPLRGLPNVILTPHYAGISEDTFERVGNDAVDDVIAFLDGRPTSHPVTRDMLDRMT